MGLKNWIIKPLFTSCWTLSGFPGWKCLKKWMSAPRMNRACLMHHVWKNLSPIMRRCWLLGHALNEWGAHLLWNGWGLSVIQFEHRLNHRQFSAGCILASESTPVVDHHSSANHIRSSIDCSSHQRNLESRENVWLSYINILDLTWRRELSSSKSVTEVLGERRPPLLERAQ